MNSVRTVLLSALALAPFSSIALAQQPATPTPHQRMCDTADNVRTFDLKNASSAADANDIFSAVRNVFPDTFFSGGVKIYLDADTHTILVCGSPESIAMAQKVIDQLDRPKKLYRLTYTVTEVDGTRRLGSQHFSMVVANNQKVTLKQGSKLPIVTGSYAKDAQNVQTQVTYLDIGMNFEASVDAMGDNIRLQTDVEQSSVGEEKSGIGPQDPVVRQTEIKAAVDLSPRKPLLLGSVDLAGSTHHLEIEVTMEPLP